MSGLKPNVYMPLFPDFFDEVDGYGDAVVAAAIRARWHYWRATGCSGLQDDEEFLQRVCRTSAQDWPEVRRVVFGRVFKQVAGVWHHDRLMEEWNRCQEIMKSRSLAGRKGMSVRWKNNRKRFN